MDEIRTERLVLRRARWSDLEPMHAILSDARAMRYWSSLPHDTLERTRVWMAGMIEAPADETDDFVIEREGKVIGKAGCWRLPEIGFILHPDYWGQRFGREALQAFIAVAFARHQPLEAITADVDPRNQPSLRLLRSLGFSETGRAARTYQLGDEWCDSVYLRLTRDRFEQGAAASSGVGDEPPQRRDGQPQPDR